MNEGEDLASLTYRSLARLFLGLRRRAITECNYEAKQLYCGAKDKLYRNRKKKLREIA